MLVDCDAGFGNLMQKHDRVSELFSSRSTFSHPFLCQIWTLTLNGCAIIQMGVGGYIYVCVCVCVAVCGCKVRHYGKKCLNNLALTLFSNAIL